MESIRPVRNEDFQNWLPLWEMYNAFYKRTVAPEITQETWRRFLDAKEPVFAFVHERDNKITGFVTYLFHRHTAMINNACYLQDLFTLESERGRGVATRLIDKVSHQAKEAGSPRIYWMTHETNETARRLYDKVAKNSGFIIYSKS